MLERTVPLRELGGRYRLRAFLAAGGMGAVWAAEDAVLGRRVAVKLLGEWLAGDPVAAERLRREARAAARLVHPNVARVLDLGEEEGRPYLVMELLEGESLAARIARSGPLAPAEAAGIAAAVADALHAAHRAGVVHRDVKPGNVFLTAGRDVKVLDFGIAAAAWEGSLTGGELIGTAAYLAPERALGRAATPAADVYALGVVLYEMLSGRPPFSGEVGLALASAHIHARPLPLRQAAPWVPAPLAAACERALAKDPTERPPSAAALADLLRAATTTRTQPLPAPATVPAPAPATVPGPVRRRRVLAVALLLALLAAALPSLGAALADLGGLEPAGGATGTTAPGQGQSPPPDTGAEGSTPAGRSDRQQGDPGPGLDDDGDQAGDDRSAGGDGSRVNADGEKRDGGSEGPGGGGGSSGPG
jgi:eukaryotic-like serine/threonine-protein kinase